MSTDHASSSTPPLKTTSRWGLWAIAAAMVGFLVWAAFAPIDEGVPTAGQVAIDTKRKTVQHLEGGIIREVLVREGQVVKEGDLLLRLDDAVFRANYESIRQRYLALRAMEARLLAEKAGQSSISFHPDLMAAADDPMVQRHMENQRQLLAARRSTLQAEMQAIEENIRGQQGSLSAFQGMLESRREQQAIVRQEIDSLRDLVQDGFVPRTRLHELNRQLAEVTAAITELQGNIVRTQQTVLELRQRMSLRRQEMMREVDSQLADVTREVEADESRYRAVQDQLARTEIRSPADGQVVGLTFQTVGGVIPPGQRIMDIVPRDQFLVLETRIMPHLINSVREGLPVDVRFNAFPQQPGLVAEGKVLTVSGDSLVDPATGHAFFLARVQLTEAGMKALGRNILQPGMPAEVIIRTGERTLLEYLLHPLIRRVAASLTEH